MKKERLQYADNPAGPTYARAVRAGNLLFISGCTAEEQEALFAGYFGGQNPATSLIEISALAQPGLAIEIEAIEVLD